MGAICRFSIACPVQSGLCELLWASWRPPLALVPLVVRAVALGAAVLDSCDLGSGEQGSSREYQEFQM